jgi:hypothetical protein
MALPFPFAEVYFIRSGLHSRKWRTEDGNVQPFNVEGWYHFYRTILVEYVWNCYNDTLPIDDHPRASRVETGRHSYWREIHIEFAAKASDVINQINVIRQSEDNDDYLLPSETERLRVHF